MQQAALRNESGVFLTERAKQKKGFVSKCSCSNRQCECVQAQVCVQLNELLKQRHPRVCS